MVLLGACSNRQVKVEMQAERKARADLRDHRADRDEIGRLSETYEAAPSTRAGGKDGVRFEGVFAERDLPSEVGNRNGWSSLPEPLERPISTSSSSEPRVTTGAPSGTE